MAMFEGTSKEGIFAAMRKRLNRFDTEKIVFLKVVTQEKHLRGLLVSL